MDVRKLGRRWLASVALGTVAPLVLAQIGPGAAGPHDQGGRAERAAGQECRRQADERKLMSPQERRTFMRDCLAARRADPTAEAGGAALREKMRQGQSGHLHSEVPQPAQPPAPAGTPPSPGR